MKTCFSSDSYKNGWCWSCVGVAPPRAKGWAWAREDLQLQPHSLDSKLRLGRIKEKQIRDCLSSFILIISTCFDVLLETLMCSALSKFSLSRQGYWPQTDPFHYVWLPGLPLSIIWGKLLTPFPVPYLSIDWSVDLSIHLDDWVLDSSMLFPVAHEIRWGHRNPRDVWKRPLHRASGLWSPLSVWFTVGLERELLSHLGIEQLSELVHASGQVSAF